jgi:hypothetical protein
MWMGGVTPIGYATKDRKLVIVPEEADPFGGRDDVLGGQQPIRFDGC